MKILTTYMSELRREERQRERERKGYDTPWWMFTLVCALIFIAGVVVGMDIEQMVNLVNAEVPPEVWP